MQVNEPNPETDKIKKSFFWRTLYFFQLADTQASPNLNKCKSHPKQLIL